MKVRPRSSVVERPDFNPGRVGPIPTGGAMQPEQQSEVVKKWVASGFLKGVKQQFLQRCAERLEKAHRLTVGGHNRDAIDRELAMMSREGLFGRG